MAIPGWGCRNQPNAEIAAPSPPETRRMARNDRGECPPEANRGSGMCVSRASRASPVPPFVEKESAGIPPCQGSGGVPQFLFSSPKNGGLGVER